MRRRQFIAGLAIATFWPVAARAQQSSGQMRRVGMLLISPEQKPPVSLGSRFWIACVSWAGSTARPSKFTRVTPEAHWIAFRDLRAAAAGLARALDRAGTRKGAVDLLAPTTNAFHLRFRKRSRPRPLYARPRKELSATANASDARDPEGAPDATPPACQPDAGLTARHLDGRTQSS